MSIEKTREETIKITCELDKKAHLYGDFVVYYLDADKNFLRLIWKAVHWNSLSIDQRFCMVKYGNFFMTEEEAIAACDRIVAKPVEVKVN